MAETKNKVWHTAGIKTMVYYGFGLLTADRVGTYIYIPRYILWTWRARAVGYNIGNNIIAVSAVWARILLVASERHTPTSSKRNVLKRRCYYYIFLFLIVQRVSLRVQYNIIYIYYFFPRENVCARLINIYIYIILYYVQRIYACGSARVFVCNHIRQYIIYY